MNKIILTTIALTLSAQIVQAQQAAPSLLIHEQFAKIDTNGDGEVSQEEFLNYKLAETKKVTAKVFQKLDTDKSGGISEEEYSQTVNNIINKLKQMSESIAQGQ